MSLKINIIANYASQLYVTAVGILILPLYIKYMGAEAYGLVGFFTMLQAWFALLDLGLSPTISRETARYRGGAMSALAYRQLFRALSLIFASIALIGGIGLLLSAEKIARSWLKVGELEMTDVILAVQIMAVAVALRWMSGLYRGVISGSERLVWLSVFNALVGTLRFIAVLLSMWIYGFTPYVFFMHQLAVALLEVVGLFLISKLLLPASANLGQPIGWSMRPVKPYLKFALTIAFTSSVWVLVTQTDKLILSGILSLADYGYFTLAVLAASGIMVISGPISNAIMPRMAMLFAEGKRDEMLQVYRNATQLVSIIVGSSAICISFFAESLLYAWTNDPEISAKAAPILALYAIGNGVLAISAFPYYLQYALGDLRYHLVGSLLTVSILVPVSVLASISYGGVGAGWAWVCINSLYLISWVGYVHRRLAPKLHSVWFLNDCFIIVVPILFVVWAVHQVNNMQYSRYCILLLVLLVAILSILISCFTSSYVRMKLKGMKSD